MSDDQKILNHLSQAMILAGPDLKAKIQRAIQHLKNQPSVSQEFPDYRSCEDEIDS